MFGKLLMNSPLLAFPLAALFIFLTVFTLVLIRVARKRAIDYAEAAALPLADDEVGHV